MSENNFQERIDSLAMLYIQNHYDIKSMSISELVKVFNKTCNEIIDAIQSTK